MFALVLLALLWVSSLPYSVTYFELSRNVKMQIKKGVIKLTAANIKQDDLITIMINSRLYCG